VIYIKSYILDESQQGLVVEGERERGACKEKGIDE